jgi:excisionase family DNA binding protein
MTPKEAIGIPDSPWLTAEEACAYLRFPSMRAFYSWLQSSDVPRGRVGRSLRFDRRVLDDYVSGRLWVKRRSA